MAKENKMVDEDIDGPTEKRQNEHGYNVVLTAYLDGGGQLNFHAGNTLEDFDDDIGLDNVGKLLRQFYIRGKIVDESGLTEPIRVI
jgi:hypothetical protein